MHTAVMRAPLDCTHCIIEVAVSQTLNTININFALYYFTISSNSHTAQNNSPVVSCDQLLWCQNFHRKTWRRLTV